MKKKQVLEKIRIENGATEGKCVARYEGKVIFVESVAPGDVVDVRITRKKKSFLEGTPVHFHEYSSSRQEPFCSHFGTCGGCKWQHIAYEHQLKFKQEHVEDCLQRIGKVSLPKSNPIIGSQKTKYYRNKLEFTFSNKRWLTKDEIQTSHYQLDKNGLGFHIPKRFDKIINIDHCYLQPDPSNAIREDVRDYALSHGLTFFDLIHQEGLLRNLIIRTANTGQVMVILQVAKDQQNLVEGLLDYIYKRHSSITSLNYIINKKRNETYQDQEVVCFRGKPYIEEHMQFGEGDMNLIFRIGAKSFYQTNSNQAYELYKITRNLAKLTGTEVVYDLYTGTGTIANFVSQKAQKVIGIEYVEAAIEDAKLNSQINNITNTEFFAGDMKDILTDEFVEKHGKPNVIITDPPRAGMHQDVVNTIISVAPQRIVYVSCNPATQARDISLLKNNYEVKTVQPIDMFPHTHHIESVVLLEISSN